MIYLGADHSGIQLKEKIKDYLKQTDRIFQDLGYWSEQPSDYPLIAEKVAKMVLKNKNNLGILICRSGQGVCLASNKIAGIRAALAWKPALAEAARRDDHANILCLAADYVSPKANLEIIKTFIGTQPANQPRYLRRLAEIEKIENSV